MRNDALSAYSQISGRKAWGLIGDITGFHGDAWFLGRSSVIVVPPASLQAGETLGRRQDAIAQGLATVIHDRTR